MKPTAMPSPQTGKDLHPVARVVPTKWWPRLWATAACSLAAAQALASPVTIAYTGTTETFAVQTTGMYTISAGGAQGGHSDFTANGGLGAQVFGDFWLTAGTVLDIVVGGSPFGQFATGGGGGGSFVYTQLNQLLLAAGGGGGAGYNYAGSGGEASIAGTAGLGQFHTTGGAGGSAGQGGGAAHADGPGGPYFNGGGGGAGWLSNGAAGAGSVSGSGGLGRADGFAGGVGSGSAGGFGGGGGAGTDGGGGGGGYSGGGGAGLVGGGGGGGSFVADVAVHTGGISGARTGNGFVSFDLLPAAADPNAVPEPGSLLLAASALGVVALLRRRPAQRHVSNCPNNIQPQAARANP